MAADSVEARRPDTSAIVLWRAEDGAEAITRGARIYIRSLDVTSDTAVVDSVAHLAGVTDSSLPTAALKDGDIIVNVPLLVDGQREGLI